MCTVKLVTIFLKVCIEIIPSDRALLYYRLLTADVNICRQLFLGLSTVAGYPVSEGEGQLCSVPDGQFAETKEDDLRKKLFEEFNSLAVIYKMPSVMFIKDKYQLVRLYSVAYLIGLAFFNWIADDI